MEKKNNLERMLSMIENVRKIPGDSLTREQNDQLNRFCALYGFTVGIGPGVNSMTALYGSLLALRDHPRYAEMRRLYDGLDKECPEILLP